MLSRTGQLSSEETRGVTPSKNLLNGAWPCCHDESQNEKVCFSNMFISMLIYVVFSERSKIIIKPQKSKNLILFVS